MIRRPLPWYRRLRFSLSHQVTLPIHHLSNRFPHYELGFTSLEISRIACRYAPLAGRRAVQISDLHLDRYHRRHDTLVETIAELRPDWIFVTGDLLNMPSGIPHVFRFLSHLRSLAPVFLILGNHDHSSGVPVSVFTDLSDRHKLAMLVNQVVFVRAGKGELGIVGLDDPSTHRADLRCLPSPTPERFTVILAHAANVMDHLDDRHAGDLVLCGHSHGGQWHLPLVPPFWLPYGCNGRVGGHFHHNGRRLYVNRGLGWSVLPARLGCPPEILVIDWTENEEG